MNKLVFKLLIIISFCQGLFIYSGISNLAYKAIVLVISLVVFFNLKMIKTKGKKIDRLLVYYTLYVLLVLYSSFYNGSQLKDIVSYILYSFPAVTAYMFIKRVHFSENEIYKLNRLVFWIMLFQIFASVIKLITWGTSEAVVGTIHFSGGSLNTLVPLLGIAMLISFYLIHGKRKIYLLGILGFIFMAWTGEKRGIYFYLIILLTYVFFTFNTIIKKIKIVKSMIFTMLIIPASVIILYVGARYAPTLNPENKIGGSFDIEHIYNYALVYSTQVDKYGLAGGRLSGLVSVFTSITGSDLKTKLIGSGASEIIGRTNRDDFNTIRKYQVSSLLGVNGWSTALISIGFLGAVLVVLFYWKIGSFAYGFMKTETDKYWKSIAYGLLLCTFVFFLDLFTYSRSTYHSIPLNLGLLYFYGILKKRNRIMMEGI